MATMKCITCTVRLEYRPNRLKDSDLEWMDAHFGHNLERGPMRNHLIGNPELARKLGRIGGASVPAEKRYWVQHPDMASAAARLGGSSVPPERRSFSTNRELARRAGRLGGMARKASAALIPAAAVVSLPTPDSRFPVDMTEDEYADALVDSLSSFNDESRSDP